MIDTPDILTEQTHGQQLHTDKNKQDRKHCEHALTRPVRAINKPRNQQHDTEGKTRHRHQTA